MIFHLPQGSITGISWPCKLPWKMYFLFSKFDILETMCFWHVCSRSYWYKHNLLDKIEVCNLDEVRLLKQFCKVSKIEGILALFSTVVSYGNELPMNRPFVISTWCRNSNLKNNLKMQSFAIALKKYCIYIYIYYYHNHTMKNQDYLTIQINRLVCISCKQTWFERPRND